MDSDPPIETTAIELQDGAGYAISVAAAYALMFGRRPPPDVLAALHENLGTVEIRDTVGLRQMIMCLDRQVHVTAATVRFSSAELLKISVEGITLLVDAADVAVSRSILQEGTYEAHVTRVFRRYIRPGWRVVDVGANVGYYSMLAASLVGSQCEVLAFDPNSENARLVLLNAAENEFHNVRLFPLALAESAGYAYFTTHIGSNGSFIADEQARLADGRGVVVPTARLDDLVHAPVDFIKLDVEGAEYRVLRGGQRLIAESRPIISSEISCDMISRISNTEPRTYLSFFARYGYAIHIISRISGQIELVVDIDALLRDWGSWWRIEDLLMLPAGTPTPQL